MTRVDIDGIHMSTCWICRSTVVGTHNGSMDDRRYGYIRVLFKYGCCVKVTEFG